MVVLNMAYSQTAWPEINFYFSLLYYNQPTFLETWEAEEFHEAEVVSSDANLGAIVGVDCVDVVSVRVFLPDPVDLRTQDTRPGRPADVTDLLLVSQLLPTYDNNNNRTSIALINPRGSELRRTSKQNR